MSSVVSIYFPGADQLPYVASLIGQSNGVQTLAISCGPGVDANTCGFPSSITVTAGPSTAYVSVSNPQATFIYDCKISASTTAVCAETFNGQVDYIVTNSASANTALTSSVLTETLASTDITWMPITITATGSAISQTSAPATATNTATATASTNSNGNTSWMNLPGSSSTTVIPSSGSSTGGSIGSSWQNLPGSSSASVASSYSSIMTGSSGSNVAWSNVGGSGATGATTAAVTSAAMGTSTGVNMSTFTGAAGKLVAIGNLAAGVLALARYVL